MQPESDEDALFWDSLRAGRFTVQRCDDCAGYQFPPGPSCWRCSSLQLSRPSLPVESDAVVYSWTVLHKSFMKFTEMTPYMVVIGELADYPGVRILARLEETNPSPIAIGAQLRLAFGVRDDGEPYYAWLRAAAAKLTDSGGDAAGASDRNSSARAGAASYPK